MIEQITIQGAHLHNLKNINLTVPKNKLVVFTGLSGSGKSTLVFDTIHKEGQRQYLESLGMVVDYLNKPAVERIEGLSPSISVDQHLTNRSPRSTVGTATEVFTYLRVLFARLGHRPCPVCGADIPPAQDVGQEEDDDGAGFDFNVAYPCPHCASPVPQLGMAHFSFNKPAGACPTCTGIGAVQTPIADRLIDTGKSIQGGAVYGWDIHYIKHYTQTLAAAAKYYGFAFDPAIPVKDYPLALRDLLYYGVESPQFRRHYPDHEVPNAVHRGRFEGVLTNILRRYADHIHDPEYREKMAEFLISQPCPDCQGTRLRPEARQVTVAGRTIVQVSQLPLSELARWLDELDHNATPEEHLIADPILDDLHERVHRLLDVGVGYLTLERASPTLSAGEAQRLRLAALLGSGLTGVLYVLDEPTIGLHPRDNERLVNMLRRLRDLGNTVLVIEHDLDMLRAADWVVDIGPGAGRNGGQVVAAGVPANIAANPASLTGAYLSGQRAMPVPARRRNGNGRYLTIYGAREHNLKNITVSFPLGMLTAVTGASGSGKSSLMFDILDRAARQRYTRSAGDLPGLHDHIEGWEAIDRVITIDQSAIGRIPRSNAATYTEVFTAIRETYAAQALARGRGLTARHFSFNTPGGRCERCEGTGVLAVKMHFLPDVQVRCPVCKGQRYQRSVLEVRYRGKSIADVLAMTIEEALALFAGEPSVSARLKLLDEVGLGYLQLGQPATTLSGGEAQRVKLARELSANGKPGSRTLYLLDEPTTGLHIDDTARLLLVLQRLVDAGNTVIVIEHNLDIIRAADWVVDLGPEGGEAGGYLIAEGRPEQIAAVPASLTGHFLQS